MSRTRERDLSRTVSGSYTILSIPRTFDVESRIVDFTRTTDVTTNFGGDNPFSTTRTKDGLGFAHGVGTSVGRRWDSFPLRVGAPGAHQQLTPLALDAFATEAAAKTNPGKPSLSLPVAVAELRDLPRSIRGIGDNVITSINVLSSNRSAGRNARDVARQVAQNNLNIQFGLAPLIGDLVKAIDIAALVEKRIREVNNLIESGGQTRRFDGPKEELILREEDKVFYTNAGLGLAYASLLRTQREIWATVRWEPSNELLGATPQEQIDLARKSVLGVLRSQQASNAWNLIPWSWLSDWFNSTGDFLASNNNELASRTTTVCVMVRTITTLTPTEVIRSNMQETPIPSGSSRVSKQRFIRYPIPFASKSPILSGRQLGILGSLVGSRS